MTTKKKKNITAEKKSQKASPKRKAAKTSFGAPVPTSAIDIAVECIDPNPMNPCTDVSDVSYLVESIREYGLINPITVRDAGKGRYTVIAGSRRLIAAKEAGLSTIPCSVRDVGKTAEHAIATIENIARQPMNPADECVAVQKMMLAGNTPRDVAAIFGRTPRWAIARARMAALGTEVLAMMREGRVTLAHAEVLCNVTDQEDILAYARNCHFLTPQQLEKNIENSLHLLARAPFDTSKKCAQCPNRTSVMTELFEENSPDRCTRPRCYVEMVKSFVASLSRKLTKQGSKEEKNQWSFQGGAGYLNEKRDAEKIEHLKEAGVKPRFFVDPETAKINYCYNEKDDPEHAEEPELSEEELDAKRQEEEFDRVRENIVRDKAKQLIIGKIFGDNFSSIDLRIIVVVQIFVADFYDDEEKESLGMKDNEPFFLDHILESGKFTEPAKKYFREKFENTLPFDLQLLSDLLQFLGCIGIDEISVTKKEVQAVMKSSENNDTNDNDD